MPETRRGIPRHAAPETVHLSELLATLERHRWLAGCVALAFVALGMMWRSTRPPLYKTSATLKLESENQGSAVLSDLAALTSAPAAEGEMSILRSRAMVEATVGEAAEWAAHGAAFTPADADDFRMDGVLQLGLTTRVESQERLPLNDVWHALGLEPACTGRLFARLEAREPGAPETIRVSFPPQAGGMRVKLSVPTRRGFPDQDELLLDYTPGAEIEYLGARLRLEAFGRFAGATYLVTHRSLKATVDEYLDKLRVEETSRNSGVIRLVVSDSDPDRAAEFANALCHNYLLRSIHLGRSRATRTIEFIERQLADQKALLEKAEIEVVALQRKNPEVILVSASAESLLKRLAEAEADHARLGLARVALSEAADLLDRGESDALARLSRELPDLVSLSYIEAIGRLGSEAQALERSDAGATKQLLQRRLEELALEEHELELRLGALDRALAELRAGDSTVLSRLFAEAPGLGALDPTTGQYLLEATRIDAELSDVTGDLKPQYPRWGQLQAARKDLEQKICVRLEAVAAGLHLAAADRTALRDTYRASLDTWPLEERARIESAVRELTQRVSHNLHARIAALASEERGLSEQVTHLEQELAQLPERERVVAEPLRRREAHAQVVKLLLDSQQQAQISAATTLPSAILIDPAIPPDERHSPRLFFDLVLCCAAGLVLGIAAAFVRQSLSGAVHTQAEVEEASGLPVLGTIPDFRHGRLRVRRKSAGFLALRDDPEGPIAEAYRSVRQSLRYALAERPLRCLAVTSCAPGEGKTTTNINIALAFAGARQRVLLIDADMRKPSVHGSFAVPQGPGLGDVLEHRAGWRECVRASGLANLDLLCAGMPRSTPGDLLRSSNIAAFIAEWLTSYDLVVFDLPPALAVADAEVLAPELDAIVLLYRSGGVHHLALSATARRLVRARARLVGTVLNAVRSTRSGPTSYYGDYHYGYGRDSERQRALQKTG